MSIDKDKIKHISKLARISLDAKKTDSLAKDLSSIFKFIEQLNELNTDKTEPLSSILNEPLRSRGDIVNDEALIDALGRRKVYAVGLDVYKGEPNLNPGYLKHKSAFILPHLGSATKETRTAMANLAIDNLEEFFKTGKCKNKVNN